MKLRTDLHIPDTGVYPELRIWRVVAAIACAALLLAAAWTAAT